MGITEKFCEPMNALVMIRNCYTVSPSFDLDQNPFFGEQQEKLVFSSTAPLQEKNDKSAVL